MECSIRKSVIEIKNIEYLRNKLLDYVGTAAFSGIPAAFGDILEIENADYDKLLEIADRLGIRIQDEG